MTQKMKYGTFHVAVDLDLIIDGILRQRESGLSETDFVKPSMKIDDALAQLFKLKSDGYIAFPQCNNHDNKGYCLGHNTIPDS